LTELLKTMMQMLFLLKKSITQVMVTAIKGIVENTVFRRLQMIEVRHRVTCLLYFYCLASKSNILETIETVKTQSLANSEMCNISRE